MDNSITPPIPPAQESPPNPGATSPTMSVMSKEWARLAVLVAIIVVIAGAVALSLWFSKLHPVAFACLCLMVLWVLAIRPARLKD